MLNEHLTDYEANASSLQNHVAQKPVGFTESVKNIVCSRKWSSLKVTADEESATIFDKLCIRLRIRITFQVWIGWLEGLHPYLVCIWGSFLKSTMLTVRLLWFSVFSHLINGVSQQFVKSNCTAVLVKLSYNGGSCILDGESR